MESVYGNLYRYSYSVCGFDESGTLKYCLKNSKCEYETNATPHDVAVKLFENVYGSLNRFLVAF